jgi:hypothetical protein
MINVDLRQKIMLFDAVEDAKCCKMQPLGKNEKMKMDLD